MTFEFKNLGAIKEAQIEMGRLTVISGKNNTGKTYLTYAAYGFLRNWLHLLSEVEFKSFDVNIIRETLKNEGKYEIDALPIIKEFQDVVLPKMCELYSGRLYQVFNTNKSEFKDATVKFITRNSIDNNKIVVKDSITLIYENSKIYIHLDNERSLGWLSNIDYHVFIRKLLFIENIYYPDILTAERSAIQIFHKEIDDKRNKYVGRFLREGIELDEDDFAKFALPIYHNIDTARIDKELLKYTSNFENREEIISYFERELLGVVYDYSDNHKEFIVRKNGKPVYIPHYMASTSVRTLSDLYVYLMHEAFQGKLLMIDEPELNLHPENQIKIARLLVKLVNAGIRVWITTHSDYIVKELNNCLMLSNDFTDKEAFMQEYGYKENDILKKEDIRVYIAHEEGTVEQVEIGKFGMKKTTFDEAIKRFNEVSDTLFNILD